MANLAKTQDIRIPEDRQRREFNQSELAELATSISNPAIGLLHPIVIRTTGGVKFLVAGERRIRAVQDMAELGDIAYHEGVALDPDTIPYTDLGDMAPLDAMEAELEENIRRANLTWQERSAASAKLMELRTAIAKEKGGSPPTIQQLAEDLPSSRAGTVPAFTTVKQDILLSRHLDDPDISSAKTSKDAMKILVRKEGKKRNERMAEMVGKTFGAESQSLINADCKDWMKTCPDGSFDVILTDPPYGMKADEFGDSGGTCYTHGYADSESSFMAIMDWLPSELFRVAKPQSHLYLFCDIDWFGFLKEQFAEAGWRVFRTPFIWHKPTAFRAPWPEKGPQRKYEILLYAIKGDKPVNSLSPDVLTHSSDKNLDHSAQKPIALYKDLLSRSVLAGDKVFDPFCGTGTIFPAAYSLKCEAVGIEIDKSYYGIATQRIKDLL